MDKKSCIDWMRAPLEGDVHGVGMPTEIAPRLEKTDSVIVLQ
jgi:hypothetical protein